MEWESLSTDTLEQELIESRALQSKLASKEIEILEELDRRQVAMADGSRSLSEWLSGRCDMAIETSRSLVRTMRRTSERPDLRSALAEGTSFDRIEALSRIQQDVGLLEWADVHSVRREAAKRARLSAEKESTTAENRYLVMQPNLDESSWRLWGELDGHSGEIVDKVLTEKADEIEAHDNEQMAMGWRKATALVETCVADDPAPAQVTVIVEAKAAADSEGETGVTLEYGRRQRTAPPTLKRALIAEANHACAVDGCVSRHRLQIHHITPWAKGGETNPAELVVLCWFHHHVAVHERGLEIILSPDRRRVRLTTSGRAPPG